MAKFGPLWMPKKSYFFKRSNLNKKLDLKIFWVILAQKNEVPHIGKVWNFEMRKFWYYLNTIFDEK